MTAARRFLLTLRRLWWVPVLCVVLGLGAGMAAGASTTPTYGASAQVLVTVGDAAATSANNTQLAISDAQLIASSAAFFKAAAGPLHADWEQLQRTTTVSNPPNTDALEFATTAATPLDAVAQANGIAGAFVSFYTTFLSQNGTPRPGSAAQVISQAFRPTRTSSGPAKDGTVGLIAGLVVAAVILGLIESTDRRIRVPSDVDDALGWQSTYVLAGRREERAHSLDLLRREVAARAGTATHARPERLVVVSAGTDESPAVAVGSLVAEALRRSGAEAISTHPVVERPAGSGRLDIATGSLVDVPHIVDRLVADVGIWVVVVALGRSTRRDVEQLRTTLITAGVDSGSVIGVCLSGLPTAER